MKLCADIIYWRLKEELKNVEFHSANSTELVLGRPEFYLDASQNFEKNRVYVCSADHLPDRPSLSENVCLVCLGQHWNLTAFYDRCNVIVVEAETDIFRVFNHVQHIFDRYEAWEEKLWYILRHGAGLPQMLEASRDIFSNPMMLIGSDFRYLAVTDEEYLKNNLGIRLDTETFDAEKLATFLSLHDLSTHIKEPLLLELQGGRTLSINMFDQEEYLGCLTIYESFRPFHDSDKLLAISLIKLLRQALQQNPVLAGTRSAVRRALRNVIAGRSVDFEDRRALSNENGKSDWVCIRLQTKTGSSPLPGAYLSTVLEERYVGAIAFEYEQSVAVLIPAEQIEKETTSQLLPILDKLGLVCGISSVFSNMYEINYAWFQSSSALQNGLLSDANGTVFYFQDYLLPQLLYGALSGRPPVSYYSEGLKRLKLHDETSPVSYMDTLRIYLENNQSVTRTAQALYLHRSTLLDRLSHITQLLDGDLKDPDYSLMLQIVLRAEIQQKQIAKYTREL